MDFANLHSSVESLEDYAEEYLLNRLSVSDRSQYEMHLLVCEECRQAFEKSEAFIRHIRRAAAEGPLQ